MSIKPLTPLPPKPKRTYRRRSVAEIAEAASERARQRSVLPEEPKPQPTVEAKPEKPVKQPRAQQDSKHPVVTTYGDRFKPQDIRIAWRPYQLRFINDPSRRRLWVKAAQIGGSTTLSSWALGRCLNRTNHLVTLVSRSQPQSDELALKARRFVKEIAGIEAQYQEGFFKGSETLERSLKFPNGSRIVALPANPDTIRSYTGDIVLDEFAHHGNPEEIFTAAYRQVTLGDFTMLITSTPNGQQGKFHAMAHELGLDLGHAPAAQPTKVGTWTGHWTDIYLAHLEGLPVNIEEIRQGCDALTWSQEYCCNFVSESELWIAPGLLDAAMSDDANTGPPALYRSGLFAGWDVARSQNKSVIWFSELMGDVTICRGMVQLEGLVTPIQIAQARAWMPQVARMNIDMTGMGLTIAETLEMEYPQKAAGVLFTSSTKEAMAVHMRLRLEQRKIRVPNDDAVRRDFLSLRRSVNKIGQARFDAEADSEKNHADRWWAACLAEMAAEQRVGQATNIGGRSAIQFDSRQTSPFSNFQRKVL